MILTSITYKVYNLDNNSYFCKDDRVMPLKWGIVPLSFLVDQGITQIEQEQVDKIQLTYDSIDFSKHSSKQFKADVNTFLDSYYFELITVKTLSHHFEILLKMTKIKNDSQNLYPLIIRNIEGNYPNKIGGVSISYETLMGMCGYRGERHKINAYVLYAALLKRKGSIQKLKPGDELSTYLRIESENGNSQILNLVIRANEEKKTLITAYFVEMFQLRYRLNMDSEKINRWTKTISTLYVE